MRFRWALEFAAQRELHDPRVCHCAAKIAKIGGISVFETAAFVGIGRLNVETDGVRNVEDFPTELQALAVAPWHLPALGQSEVYAKEAWSTEIVAHSRFSRKCVAKAVRGRDSVGEEVGSGGTDSVVVRTGIVGGGGDGAKLIGVPLQLNA